MPISKTPVGGVPSKDFFLSRDWFDPLRPYFCHEPIPATRGRRTAVCTGNTQYKAFDRALYLSTSAGANLVYEIGSTQLITVSPAGGMFGNIWDSYFHYEMTLNRSSGNPALAAGECCQGFGIGSMVKNTPWEGVVSNFDTCVFVRFNLTRVRWELFAASQLDNGISVALSIQPNTPIDTSLPCIVLEWNPPNTIKVYFNNILVHTQSLSAIIPIIEGGYSSGVDAEQILFLTNGSNAGFGHSEAGFYMPRFYQAVNFQGI
jgi:hypothetical protein